MIAHFEALKTLIKQRYTAVKTVDIYNRQYQRTEKLKAIQYPAVYIDFGKINWNGNHSDGSQTANNHTIVLHFVNYDVDDSPVPTLTLAEGLHTAIKNKKLKDNTNQTIGSNVT